MRVSDICSVRVPVRAGLAAGGALPAFRLPEFTATRGVERLVQASICARAEAQREAVMRRRRAVRQGRAVLDALDQIRLDGLSGESTVSMARLTSALAQAEELSGDPVLDELTGHIRLRAAVEIAKRQVRYEQTGV